MREIVSQLTIEEKAGLVSGASFWTTRPVERLGIPAVTMTDGPHGVRLQLASADHLGLNASEPATSFPTACATGSSWDPALLTEMGRALAAEARALGGQRLPNLVGAGGYVGQRFCPAERVRRVLHRLPGERLEQGPVPGPDGPEREM